MAQSILDVAPTEGEKGVALLAGEKTSLVSPKSYLSTRLTPLHAPGCHSLYNISKNPNFYRIFLKGLFSFDACLIV